MGPPQQIYHVSAGGSDGRTCEQALSEQSPLRTIQAGVVCAQEPGAVVEVHGGTYRELVERWHSGVPGSPIVVRAAEGETVRWEGPGTDPESLRGAVVISDESFIRIEGITFQNTVTGQTVRLWRSPGTPPMQGIEIVGNRFIGNGSPSSRSRILAAVGLGHGVAEVPSVLVEGNLFDGNHGADVYLRATTHAHVVDNVMRNGLANTLKSGRRTHRGVFVGGERGAEHSVGNLVRGNHIHDFHNVASAAPFVPYGIKLDVNADSTTIAQNRIHDISGDPNAEGIMVESRCDHTVVRQNLVYRIGGDGIRVGSKPTTAPVGTRILHNTIYDVGTGIFLNNAASAELQGNIVSAAHVAGIVASEPTAAAGGHLFAHNDYHRGDPLIARWDQSGETANLTLPEWAARSGEHDSMSADPLFVSTTPGAEDFHLRSASPAIGAGPGGTDLGAYP